MAKTTKKRLALSKAELDLELAKVLGPWKHGKLIPETGIRRHEQFTGLQSLDVCEKCEKDWEWCEVHPCPIPNPIDSDDWNVAMEWRDWVINESGFAWYDIFEEVASTITGSCDCDTYFAFRASPRDFLVVAVRIKELIAAARAKEKE